MELRIAAPCPMKWSDLRGDGKVRHCDRCRLNVYNLADMGESQVRDLVRATEGRLCGRLYVREDGWATSRNCSRARMARWIRRGILAAAALLAVIGGTALASTDRPQGATRLGAMVEDVLVRIGLVHRPAPKPMVGEICIPAPAPNVKAN